MRGHFITAFFSIVIAVAIVWFLGHGLKPGPLEDEIRLVENPVVFALPITGWSTIEANPDEAVVTMGVYTEGLTAAEAVAANNRNMQTVFEHLRAFGVDNSQMNTSNLRVQPQYSIPTEEEPEREIIGYTAENQIVVTFTNLDTLGDAIDAAFQSGSNRLIGIRFEVSERRALEARARTEAVVDAREQAELIAEAAGLRLGRLIGMNVGSGPSVEAPNFVIAGSRIARTDVNGESPIRIFSGEALRSNGMQNLGESLRQALSTGSGGFSGSAPQPPGVSVSAGSQDINASVVLIFEFLRPDTEDEE